ncbi:MAG TPA: sigma-70 family RNA polymerase sigma factor [Longimicrobiales bacterium]|nr:sigma-70 family RNA polymerase sigma factor [Longimicrobiales bacterium]
MPDPSGDKAGFAEEALPHLDAVYRFALRLTGSRDEAEDLVQETFLRAFRSWDQYTPGTRAKSWLFTICRNVFLRRRERERRHDEIVAESAGREGSDASPVNPVWVSVLGVDPEGDFFESIVDERILQAIDELPDEYATAVLLSDLEGLPYAEIAELTGVPVGTVKSRLFRGRRRLQEKLYEYAVEMGYIPARAGTDASG